jgi:hypothetical protein
MFATSSIMWYKSLGIKAPQQTGHIEPPITQDLAEGCRKYKTSKTN